MSSTHKRDVAGMHAAPRCQALTKSNHPCCNPAVKGKTRCRVHGGMGAGSKNYREEANDDRFARLESERQVLVGIKLLDKAIRKRERGGESAEQLADMHAARRVLHHLAKQRPSELSAAYRPPEADRLAQEREAAALNMRREYQASGHRSLEMIRDRGCGAMLGLAVGEAVGLTLTGWPRDSYQKLEDMVGRGRLDLNPGEWAGDTAMALALMDSLTFRGKLDESDFIGRLIDWRDDGAYSCTGACVGMGGTISEALARYERTGEPVAGEAHPGCVANGSLARMAPVAIRYWRRRHELRDVAVRQSLVTHAGPIVIPACIGFAQILADAISGLPRDQVLMTRIVDFAASRSVVLGEWSSKKRGEISGSNNAFMTLEAALWCVGRTDSFEEAVLAAANLGEDSGSTAAVTGQLAGALYGACNIPTHWRERLAWHDRILDRTDALFAQSQMRAGGARL